ADDSAQGASGPLCMARSTAFCQGLPQPQVRPRLGCGGVQVTSRATLTEDGTLVVQRLSTPIDLGEAVRDRIFTGLHVYGKPTNLRLLASLTHLVQLRLQSTGHTDFMGISGLTRLAELSYFSGSLKVIDLSFAADTLRRLGLGRQRSL